MEKMKDNKNNKNNKILIIIKTLDFKKCYGSYKRKIVLLHHLKTFLVKINIVLAQYPLTIGLLAMCIILSFNTSIAYCEGDWAGNPRLPQLPENTGLFPAVKANRSTCDPNFNYLPKDTGLLAAAMANRSTCEISFTIDTSSAINYDSDNASHSPDHNYSYHSSYHSEDPDSSHHSENHDSPYHSEDACSNNADYEDIDAKAERQNRSLIHAELFVVDFNDLTSLQSKALNLRNYMFNEIQQHILQTPNPVNIKNMVEETINNPILKELWLLPKGAGQDAALADNLANNIVGLNVVNLRNSATPEMNKIIFAHMSTQIYLINCSQALNVPLEILADDETYAAMFNQRFTQT